MWTLSTHSRLVGCACSTPYLSSGMIPKELGPKYLHSTHAHSADAVAVDIRRSNTMMNESEIWTSVMALSRSACPSRQRLQSEGGPCLSRGRVGSSPWCRTG